MHYAPPSQHRRARDYNEMQHFHSRPELQPPALVVSAQLLRRRAPGDIFAAPYSGPGPSGPMIFDEAGNLVWFHPLPRGDRSRPTCRSSSSAASPC